MGENAELEVLDAVSREVKKGGRLTGTDLTKLNEVFGQRFVKAFEVLKENRVKKYFFKPSNRVIWIVVGKKRDYLIMPKAEFCTCDDFYFRVLDRKIHMCYHLIAQKLAENLDWYEIIEERDELFDSLMLEWKKATV